MKNLENIFVSTQIWPFLWGGEKIVKIFERKKLKKEILAINPLYIIKFKMVYQKKIGE